MKVVAAVWLCLSRIWSSRFSSGWSVKPQSKTTRCSEGANVQSRGACGLYMCVCVCLLSVDWTDAFDCFNVRPILVLSRLTCGMEINDDLHVNGPPSCISQGRGGEEEWSGSFVCVYTEHFTFYIILPLKRTGLLQKLETHTHTHPRPGQSRSCNTTATGRALLSFGMI